jgi:hypothetical protein
VARTDISADAPELRGFGNRWVGWWLIGTSFWMGSAFLISLALAAITFAAFGAGEEGTALALRVTARWCFVLFWFAYVAGAMARLCGPRLGGLSRRGREFGLAFASALLVHVGLVLWLFHVAPAPGSPMIFFWVGVLGTCLLALLSLPRLRDALGLRLWRILLIIALEYIALVFADDFILEPLQDGGYGTFPLSYLPFAVMLVGGAGLRFAAFARRWTLISASPT